MKNSKGIKELIFFSFLLLASLTKCDDVNSYDKKPVQIKVRNSGKCLKRTSLRSSRIVISACNPNDPNSLWFLTNIGNGVWKIMSFNNDMFFDVRGGSKDNLAVLQVYSWGNSNNQKWWINNKGGDFWEIKSTDSNKCVDVHEGRTTNLGGMVMYDCHGGHNQQFSFHTIALSQPSVFKQGAVYRIRSGSGNTCLEFNGFSKELTQNTCNTDDPKKNFKLYQNNDGSYLIKPLMDLGQSSDVLGFGTNNGSSIGFWSFNRSDNQKVFIINAQDENKYYIRDVNSGKCYDRPGGTTSYSRIQIWECQDNNWSQYWHFDEVSYVPDFQPNLNKFYRIKQNGSNPATCITNSRRKATPLTRAACNDNDNSQLWKFSAASGGFVISSYMEAKSLDVLGFSVENSTPVVAWETLGYNNQIWFLRSRREGVFSIVSAHSKKCLQFPSDVNEKVVSLSQFDCWDFSSQEFTFEEREPSNLIKPNKPYRIYHSITNKCLKYNGVYKQITQENCDGSDGTKFAFSKNSNDASYYIQPYFNLNESLDISGFGKDNGTKVQAWSINFTWNQKLFLFGYDSSSFYIRDGNSDKCFDLAGGSSNSGVIMQIWECMSNNTNQSFKIEELPILLSDYYSLSGYVQIKNVNSNMCLAFNSLRQANQVPCNTSDESSFWMIEYNSADNSYFIKNKINNNYLDNSGYSLNNDNVIHGWSKHGGDNQRFKFEFDDATISSSTVFNIRNVQSKKCLKIFNAQTTSFSGLVGYDCVKNASDQQFKLVGVTVQDFPKNNNYYSFKSLSSNQCLKFNALNSNTGEYTCDELNSTRFKLVSSEFGSYFIVSSADTNNYLHAHGSEGSFITTRAFENDDFRRFFITAYNTTSFAIRHYKTNLCVSNENGSFILRNCNTNDSRQSFTVSDAKSQWENIYENGESC